jgi:hypothetical protein
MSRWFRMYDEVLDDPKVQRLSGEDFKTWVNLLCLASRNDGRLPDIEDIGFALRLDAKRAKAAVGRLCSAGLIATDDDGFAPHKWNDRQYKSDVSTGRVKRFRERSKERAETATETAPDTEADTETEYSVAKATAEVIPIDPEKVMFDAGIELLGRSGKSPSQARGILGRWKRDHPTGDVIEALGAAQRQGVIDPVPWIEARWKGRRVAETEGFSIGGTRMSSPC